MDFLVLIPPKSMWWLNYHGTHSRCLKRFQSKHVEPKARAIWSSFEFWWSMYTVSCTTHSIYDTEEDNGDEGICRLYMIYIYIQLYTHYYIYNFIVIISYIYTYMTIYNIYVISTAMPWKWSLPGRRLWSIYGERKPRESRPRSPRPRSPTRAATRWGCIDVWCIQLFPHRIL